MEPLNKNTRVDDAGFSRRARNILLRRSEDTFDIHHTIGEDWRLTLGDLEGISKTLLEELPGCGKKSAQEIADKCRQAGVYIRE